MSNPLDRPIGFFDWFDPSSAESRHELDEQTAALRRRMQRLFSPFLRLNYKLNGVEYEQPRLTPSAQQHIDIEVLREFLDDFIQTIRLRRSRSYMMCLTELMASSRAWHSPSGKTSAVPFFTLHRLEDYERTTGVTEWDGTYLHLKYLGPRD